MNKLKSNSNTLMNILHYGNWTMIIRQNEKHLYAKLYLFLFPSSIKEYIVGITYLFNKYFLSVFYVLRTVLSSRHAYKQKSTQRIQLLNNRTKINHYKSSDF